jgi:2-oxoglutarate/2-oxoacid ferredoxin oxidoreductase subunit beta
MITPEQKSEMSKWSSAINPTWCPGCGDFGIYVALKQALVQLGLRKEDVMLVFGIGCSGNAADFYDAYGIHGLHGRAITNASAAKLANHKQKVIVLGGDGDGYGIGLSHYLHTSRRNLDITYIVHNNQIYGLTTGQTSPTTDKGTSTKSTPLGAIEEPIHPLELSISSDATFIARSFAGDVEHMTSMFIQAIEHKGFSHIDVLQFCPSFNKKNTAQWYKDHVYNLEQNYKPDNRVRAFERAQERDRLPLGIFFRETGKPTYADECVALKSGQTLVEQTLELTGKTVGVSRSFKKYR